MKLPELINISTQRKQTERFGGINQTESVTENEFIDAFNLSAAAFPVLTTRAPRVFTESFGGTIDGIFYNEALWGIFYDGHTHKLKIYDKDSSDFIERFDFKTDEYIDYPECNKDTKSVFLIENQLCLLDVVDINNPNFTRVGESYKVEPNLSTSTSTWIIDADTPGNYCRLRCYYEDGTEITKCQTFATYKDMDGTSVSNDVLCFVNQEVSDFTMAYRSNNSNKLPVDRVKVRFSTPTEIGFQTNDYILIKDLKYPVSSILAKDWEALNGYHTVVNVGKEESVECGNVTFTDEPYFEISVKPGVAIHSIINDPRRGGYGYFEGEAPTDVNEPIPRKYAYMGAVFEHSAPMLDMVCECNNRLWGASNEDHTIYASELGNERNWYKYEGISSDSYAVTIATEGDFTRCANYNGVPIFFKENEIIKINGSRPASFSISSYKCKGMRRGTSLNATITVDGVLYYVGADGIYSFADSLPKKISDNIRDKSNEFARIFAVDTLLYVITTHNNMYTYDIKRGIWHRESDIKIPVIASSPDGKVYMPISGNGKNNLIVYDPNTNEIPEDHLEDDFSWHFITAPIYANTPDAKYITRIDASIENKGTCRAKIKFDGRSDWLPIGELSSPMRKNNIIRIAPRRCDYFQLMFEGEGEFKLFSMTKTLEEAREYG